MKISKTKTVKIYRNNTQRVKAELRRKITEQILEFKYPGHTISLDNKDTLLKIKPIIKWYTETSFGRQISRETQLRFHNIALKQPSYMEAKIGF